MVEIHFPAWLQVLISRAAQVAAEVKELEERRDLLNRPWEEEFLHWAHDGQGWQLHGHWLPDMRKRSRSVTSTGWCPGLLRQPPPAGSGGDPD